MIEANLNQNQPYDLLIIGGGINGVAIAAEAAERGLSVLLCEQNDLASATSSASTKLIHGGLRYLEFYDFAMVRKALQERDILWRTAPHIIQPLSFILPDVKGGRPSWLIRIGLWLYDHLGGKSQLAKSSRCYFGQEPQLVGLQKSYQAGFRYSDCWVDDSRLVVLTAAHARRLGAEILTRHKVESFAKTTQNDYQANISGAEGQFTAHAKIIVNAAGPWLKNADALDQLNAHSLQFVLGSHIVVPQLFSEKDAYILPQPDGRIVFAIPYEDNFTLIGTTERVYSGPPEQAQISEEEKEYLCACANRFLAQKITPKDIVASFAGIRTLEASDNVTQTSREYKCVFDASLAGTGVLSIIGGKLTTHRRLGIDAVDRVASHFPHCGPSISKQRVLPGGELASLFIDDYVQQLQQSYPNLPSSLLQRLAKLYGRNSEIILAEAKQLNDLGKLILCDLSEAEINYLCQHEWAQTAEDILWRRTKLGLHCSDDEYKRLHDYLKSR